MGLYESSMHVSRFLMENFVVDQNDLNIFKWIKKLLFQNGHLRTMNDTTIPNWLFRCDYSRI